MSLRCPTPLISIEPIRRSDIDAAGYMSVNDCLQVGMRSRVATVRESDLAVRAIGGGEDYFDPLRSYRWSSAWTRRIGTTEPEFWAGEYMSDGPMSPGVVAIRKGEARWFISVGSSYCSVLLFSERELELDLTALEFLV